MQRGKQGGERGGGRRIRGGGGRGRPLLGSVAAPTRPTSARVRQAIFDLLGRRILGAEFLDGYAGTGAVGIEALGRGARRVVFVERDARAVQGIRADLGPQAAGCCEILALDVEQALDRLRRSGSRFTIVFLDPPYGDPGLGRALDRAAGLTAPGGIVVVEHRRTDMIDPPAGARVVGGRTYRHGDTALTTFILAGDGDR
jgi:16S rRNA (guanine(966)-N(2))-methyltransferase RsmD